MTVTRSGLWQKLEGKYPPRVTLGVFGCTLLVFGILCFLAGARYFGSSMVEKRQQQSVLQVATGELARLGQEKVNLEVADTVNRASLEQLRAQVVFLQEEIGRQERELSLYRNLLRDDEDSGTLEVDSLSLRHSLAPNTYLYRIVVRRRAALSKAIDASVSLSIEGLLNGQQHSVPFNEADLSLQGDGLSIRFKYFKVLRGSLVLPEGFTPHKVVLTALEKGKANSLRIKDFPWVVEEDQPSP